MRDCGGFYKKYMDNLRLIKKRRAKSLKRKGILRNRVLCHGDIEHCRKHTKTKVAKKVRRKLTWWQKFIKWLYANFR